MKLYIKYEWDCKWFFNFENKLENLCLNLINGCEVFFFNI